MAQELNEKQLAAKIAALLLDVIAEKDKGTNANQQTITTLQSKIAPLKTELKKQRSKRLANMRVNNAVKKISLVENLATVNYSFTDEQKEQIVMALSNAVSSVDNAFNTKQVLTDAFCI